MRGEGVIRMARLRRGSGHRSAQVSRDHQMSVQACSKVSQECKFEGVGRVKRNRFQTGLIPHARVDFRRETIQSNGHTFLVPSVLILLLIKERHDTDVFNQQFRKCSCSCRVTNFVFSNLWEFEHILKHLLACEPCFLRFLRKKTRAMADLEWDLQVGMIQSQKHYLAVLVTRGG